MDQRAVNKVLRDMKMHGLITLDEYGEVRSGEARFFLNALWVAGLEEGNRKQYAGFKKTVILYNTEGIEVDRFESVAEASRRKHISIKTIYQALTRNSISRNGHYWRYAEKGNNSESEEAE